ncbi:bromodomain adjacent to zinc finger domain protein 2B-like isoform X4 [Ptychodera flava]|uniref:bromodomain adjacent to zinc finger domain protein 2B-like isoform X4 n=1 Tax=Ptychodera flava TaxID=63121 RepID=UPI00396A8B06
MDPGENPSQKSPVGSRGFFDPAHILGPPMFPTRPPTSRDQPYVAHMPSAFSMFGQPMYPPRSPHSEFGGLGNLRDSLGSPLGSPSALAHSPLSPTAGLHWPLTASVHLCNLATLGGAAWWRHARSMAGLNEFYSGTLGLTAPTFGSTSRERESSPPGFDSLYRQSQAQKNLNGAFSGSLFQSTSASTPFSLSSPTKTSSPSSSSSLSSSSTAASSTLSSTQATVTTSTAGSSITSPAIVKPKRGRPKGSGSKNSSIHASSSSSSTLDRYKDTTSSAPMLLLPHPPPLTSVPTFTHSSVITKAATVTSSSPPISSPLNLTTSGTGAASTATSAVPPVKSDVGKKKAKKEEGSSSDSSSSDDDDSDAGSSSSSSSSNNSDVSSASDDSDTPDTESDSDDKEMQQIIQTKKQLEEKQKQLLKQEQQLKQQQKEALERKLKVVKEPLGKAEQTNKTNKQPNKQSSKQQPKDQQDSEQHIRQQEQRLKQEQLKIQLEQHIKQQQHQLKLQKKAQAEREKAFAAKAAAVLQQGSSDIAEKLLEGSSQGSMSSSQGVRSNQTSVITQAKSHKNKSQAPTKEEMKSSNASPATKATSTPIVAKFRGVNYNEDDSDKDSGSSDSSDSDDSQSGLSDSDSDDDSDSSDDDDSNDDDDDDDENTDTDAESKAASKQSPSSTPVKTSTPIENSNRKRSSEEAVSSTPPSSVVNSSAASTPTPAKRRRMHDENEARSPLEYGWRRQTIIRQLGPGDRLRGDVMYFAPCGKKIKTYPEVIRYLEKHRVTGITRDNFSFSVKIKVGEFLNPKQGENGIVYEAMTEHELRRKLVQDDPKKLRALERQLKREEKRRTSQELARKAAENKMRRRLEQQEMAKRAAEAKRRRKMERLTQSQMAKEAKRNRALMAAEERRRQKEHLKLLKQQEKLQRLEQIRIDKEMRAQQLLEERELRRQQAVILKTQERERRKHLLVMMEQERERRKQHMMLVRALEARKKAEERERIKQEKKAEKKFHRERKLEQKRFEVQMAKELKKPIEDMKLTDLKQLPNLERLQGVKLPSNAFSDCLMVLEFLHNFGEALGLDLEDDVPTLDSLQDGLLNDEESYSEVVTLCIQLLNLTLQDPGLPGTNGKEKTLLDQSVSDIDIDEDNFSEVLRLYLKHSNGKDNELSEVLQKVPFMALSATQKASCLAFLVNDLVCSSRIAEEIDKSIENMSSLRRHKWIIEGKLRKMRTIQAKKFNRPMPPKPITNEDSLLDVTMDGDNSNLSGMEKKRKRDDEEEEEEEEEKENESDGMDRSDGEEGEDEAVPTSAEEMDKKIEKLTRQQSQFRTKLFEASHSLRAMSFGQDRFRRRYWVLPHAGGIYVEGMASGEMPDDMENERKHQEDVDEQTPEKSEQNQRGGQTDAAGVTVKKEDALQGVSTTSNSNSCASETQPSVKTEPQQNQNLFLQKPESFSKLSELLQVAKQSPESSNSSASTPATSSAAANVEAPTATAAASVISSAAAAPHCQIHSQAPPLQTFRLNSGIPTSTSPEVNGGFVKLDNYLQKNDGHFAIGSPLTAGHVSAEQLLKGLVDRPNGTKPWFSILPRMPCDESSLTRTHSTPTKSMQELTLPAFGVSAFHIPGAAFSAIPIPGLKQASPIPTLAFPGIGHGFIPVSAYGLPNSQLHASTTSQGILQTNKETIKAQVHSEAMENMKALLAEREDKEAATIPDDLKHGWWHITDAEIIKNITRALHPRGIRERQLQKNLLKYADFACAACNNKGSEYFKLDTESEDSGQEESSSSNGEPLRDSLEWSQQVAFDVHKSTLQDVEALEDKVFSSSMQVKGWKPRVKASSEDNMESLEMAERAGVNVIDAVKERLMSLEKSVERRYLKAPLSKSNVQINLDKMGRGQSQEDRPSSPNEDVAKGLAMWRSAVKSATNISQLRMCIELLESSIAWEKSIMKVFCQFCRKGDNEELLLLCDGCDKGFHTYCFKPKMPSIPEGDWYCYECIYKATGECICVMCRSKGKLVKCENCPRAYHPDCLDPPLSKIPRGKWLCQWCQKQKNKTSRGKGKKQKAKEVKEASSPSSSDTGRDTDWIEKFKEDKVNRKQSSKDMAPCRAILAEMEKHDDGWPFLVPVDTKQFSTYKKVIKHPMDFHTMKCKLRDGQYRNREEFASDARLVFHNCNIFNEDDSDVGRSGHSMKRFFEKRWAELCSDE